ncbi:MAG: hypothetical protein ACYSTS_12900 [Planctomycetota bacterium]|jgi:hypothetical protein
MSKKQIKASEKSSTPISSTLENTLLSYAKKGQPVLLYGKDTSSERVNLIKNIHLANGGIDSSWEYEGYEGNDKSSLVILDAMTKALAEHDTEKAKSYLHNCRVTHKTWRRVNCDFTSGKDVFDMLHNKVELFSDGFGRGGILRSKFHKYDKKASELYKEHMDSFFIRDELHFRTELLFCPGLLFVDRLKCTPNDPKDEEWYSRLGKLIEERKRWNCDSGDWLVAYTRNPYPFPDVFKDPFELVPLDGEEAVIVTVSETAKPSKQQEEKNLPLYEKTPKGAKWQDLTMAFPNHLPNTVDVIFKGNKKDPAVSLKGLGFLYKRSTRVFKESLKLLKMFAEDKDNNLSAKGDTERNRLHAQVESLRNILIRCFGINGDPVLSSVEGGYKLQFKAYCYDKKGEEKLLNNLRTYLRKLKNETNETKSVHDDVIIKELKKLIYVGVEKYLETNQSVSLKYIICTECYEKIPLCIIDSDNLQVLCSECNQM